MGWQIEFDPRALKELKKLDGAAQKRIIQYLKTQVAVQSNPRLLGRSLKGNKQGLWRYRVGNSGYSDACFSCYSGFTSICL